MKSLSLFLISCLVVVTTSFGQDITRQEADSILIVLSKSKPDVKRIDLLITLAQFHILKPGENQIDFDSAEVYLKKAEALNASLKSTDASGYLLLTRSFMIKEKGQTDEGKKMAEQAIAILQSGNNKDYLGQAYFGLSWYYDYSDSLQCLKKIELVEQSVDAFQQSGDTRRKARSLEMLGDLYSAMDEYSKAIEVLNQALIAYDSAKYERVQGVYVLLGDAYRNLRDNNQSLSYLLKALKTARHVHDSSMQLCQITNLLASLYRRIDRMEMAMMYLKMSLDVAQKHQDEYSIYFLSTNLSIGYSELGQPDEALKALSLVPPKYLSSSDVNIMVNVYLCYTKVHLFLRQYDKAWPYCEKMLAVAENPALPATRRSAIYRDAANFYLDTKQYSKTHYYLAKTEEIDNGLNSPKSLIEDARLAYKLDSAEGNFASAFKHLLFYKQKNDSVLNVYRAKQLEVLSVEYEVEMKEDSIKSKDKDIAFLKQKTNLQQANLQQAHLIKNMTIAGAVLLMILLGLIYNRYRQKQKTTRILQSQKEEINKNNQTLQHLNEQQTKLLTEKDWLVKEIHHRVKNNLQMVVSLLNAQTEFLTHPSAIDAIKESRERMQAIAIIHQKLYQLDNSTKINMRSYINELIDNIKNSFADSERIYFKVDVADVSLDISQSVPLGLILNEAITNAIKYAYPESEKGSIQISLKHYNDDKLQLKIADNGKGLPADVDIEHSNSLGMQLIRLFSEQLEGDLYFTSNNGLEITLDFKNFEDKNFESGKITA